MSTVFAEQVVGKGKINRFFIVNFLICMLAMTFDGYDINVFGITVPLLMKDFRINAAVIGLMSSAGMGGMILGSIIFGMLADRIGRKNTIMIGTALFGLCTGSVGLTQTPLAFGIFRFLAGVALAGVIPNLITATSEYAPENRRSSFVTICTIGITLGTFLATYLGIVLLGNYSWRIMFYVAYIFLLLVILQYLYLPDSLGYLLKKGERGKVVKILTAANPKFVPNPDDEYRLDQTITEKKTPFVSLFQRGFVKNTILFWLILMTNMWLIYSISVWLPKLMMLAGYTLHTSLLFTLIYNLGGIVGVCIWGFIADKYGNKITISISLVCCVVVALVVGAQPIASILMILLFIIGAAVNGLEGVYVSHVARCYPAACRSTGMGWVYGVGRAGGLLGPMVGGLLIAYNFPQYTNFVVMAIAPLIGFVALRFTTDYTKIPFPNVDEALLEASRT
jgi:AAHS family benzoate transporter-like MFS transporter